MVANLIIIFSKDPVIGQVKTRIAHELGDEFARDLYLQMLKHTRVTIDKSGIPYMVYTNSGRKNFSWGTVNVKKQMGRDLGEKMGNAIISSLQSSEKVCLIGTDNFEITPEILNTAVNQLDQCDVVLGPAQDGGYYLIGMKSYIPELFINKSWSSETVLRETLKDLEHLEKSYHLLPLLNDCDRVDDIPARFLNNFVTQYS